MTLVSDRPDVAPRPASTLSERALRIGYGLASFDVRTEECACGDRITSVETDGAIKYAVGLHNASSARHAAWRAWMEGG